MSSHEVKWYDFQRKEKINTTDKTFYVLRTLTDTDTNKYLKLNESK